jgi:PadR family transcriptional regulator PadR
VRRTHALVQMAAALAENPGERKWGYGLWRRTGLLSGTMYPILWRMLEAGWLSDGWEDQGEAAGRPPRRYYVVTDAGRAELGAILDAARRDPRFRAMLAPPAAI